MKKIIVLFIFSLMLFVNLDAMAFTLKKGTISLGGGSTFEIGNHDSDKLSSTDYIRMSFNSGYFIVDKLEVGGAIGASYSNSGDYEGKGFSISPFVTYHFDLNAASNIYITGMVGYARYSGDSDWSSSETDGTLLSTEIGWEYFFNPSISATIGAIYYSYREKREMHYNHSDNYYNSFDLDIISSTSNTTSSSFSTRLGFKFYF